MNPFEEKPQKIEKSFQSWKNVLVKPYDKQTVDPYTRLRVILMNGTEFESVRLGHSYTRNCTNNDIRRELALIRRSEQLQQKRIQAHAPSSIMLTVTLLCAGIFLGVMTQTGMVLEMSKAS